MGTKDEDATKLKVNIQFLKKKHKNNSLLNEKKEFPVSISNYSGSFSVNELATKFLLTNGLTGQKKVISLPKIKHSYNAIFVNTGMTHMPNSFVRYWIKIGSYDYWGVYESEFSSKFYIETSSDINTLSQNDGALNESDINYI